MKFIILLVFTFCVNPLMLRSVKDKITEGVKFNKQENKQRIHKLNIIIESDDFILYHSAYNRLAYYIREYGSVDALYKDIEKMGFDRVWKENLIEIISWMRGEESVTLFEPKQIQQKLNMIGLGWTPTSTVKRDVEGVHSFKEFQEIDVKGKIG